jgi:hypothetical protein
MSWRDHISVTVIVNVITKCACYVADQLFAVASVYSLISRTQPDMIQYSGESDGMLVMRRRLTGEITSRRDWDSSGCLGVEPSS